MVDSLLVTFSALLLLIGSTHAQISAPNCSASSMAWSFNSLSQGPCIITAFLAAVCNNGTFAIPALLPQNSYTGPNGPDNGDLCKCNTVTYSLISACAACQGGSWITYPAWITNCTSVAPVGTFPESIPLGTRVPNWAYLDPTQASDKTWNASAALLAGDLPEITGSISNVPTSTRSSQSTFTPQTTSSPSNSSSKGGAIAGGVVGGIVGAALIAAVVAWMTVRRRRHARSASSAAAIDDQSDMGQGVVPYPIAAKVPRLYDPSDPSTYPTQASPSTIHTSTTNYSSRFTESKSSLQPTRQGFTGLPEV